MQKNSKDMRIADSAKKESGIQEQIQTGIILYRTALYDKPSLLK